MSTPARDSEAAVLARLLAEVRTCRVCAAHLPLGPSPVVRGSTAARIMIISQAPGTAVHRTGLSFDDPSGDRLRRWLDVDRDTFYDESRFAMLPMGFCYPGRYARGGDLPPRPECAPQWRAALLERLPLVQLTLLVGAHAQRYHLATQPDSVTAAVRAWRDGWPAVVPLPHPSPRNRAWLVRNPWFGAEVLPQLRRRVAEVLQSNAEARR